MAFSVFLTRILIESLCHVCGFISDVSVLPGRFCCPPTEGPEWRDCLVPFSPNFVQSPHFCWVVLSELAPGQAGTIQSLAVHSQQLPACIEYAMRTVFSVNFRDLEWHPMPSAPKLPQSITSGLYLLCTVMTFLFLKCICFLDQSL